MKLYQRRARCLNVERTMPAFRECGSGSATGWSFTLTIRGKNLNKTDRRKSLDLTLLAVQESQEGTPQTARL